MRWMLDGARLISALVTSDTARQKKTKKHTQTKKDAKKSDESRGGEGRAGEAKGVPVDTRTAERQRHRRLGRRTTHALALE